MRAWEIDPEILQPPIIDIGSGKGPLKCKYPVRTWDLIDGDGDATYMLGVENESYRTVYSHHLLEHLDAPIAALQNWWRILKPKGHLIVTVPSWRYYEKKRTLPSRFNPEHKSFWDLDKVDPPNIFSLVGTMRLAIPYGELISLRLIKDGYVELPRDQQSPDGFHLEIVVKKS